MVAWRSGFTGAVCHTSVDGDPDGGTTSFMLWDTEDAEIKDLSVEITELKGSPFIKPGTALHASLTARDFFLISTSRYIRLHFFQTSPDFSPCVNCG